MSLKSILVHLDSTPQSPARYDLALDIARRHQACLVGYFPTTSPYFSLESEERSRDASRARCVTLAEQAGVPFDWVGYEFQPGQPLATRLTQQAFYADLVVVGQPGSEAGPPPAPPRDLPERLVLTTGRPVLTVPFALTFHTLGKRALVAWKAGRSSVRALYDALPLLSGAEEVILVSLAMTSTEQQEEERSLQAIQRSLQRHGIEAQTEQRLISGIGLGDALLNRVAEEGVDLLVAGGMAPSQIGPVAGHLLRNMTVPVLMSS